MRAKKAKAIRKAIGYMPSEHRPKLAAYYGDIGDYARGLGGRIELVRSHPRRKYLFAKMRYHMIPFAQFYKRMSMSRQMLDQLAGN